MRCNQSGQVFKVAVEKLCLVDGEPIVSEEALKPSNQVLVDVDKKSYIATVIKVVNEGKWVKLKGAMWLGLI